MATEPAWPVFFLEDDGDVTVIEDVSELPATLDPILVDYPIRLIDTRGRRLRKVVSKPEHRKWRLFQEAPEIVGVEVIENGEDASEELRQALTTYLADRGVALDWDGDMETFARAAAPHVY